MLRLKQDDRITVTFILNGREISGPVEPRTLLSDFLRQNIGETGTHVGCEHGICGACTVAIEGLAVRSCLTLAIQADGRRVDTVEGLAGMGNALTPLQEAFHRHHALQCGFCTPGLLISLTALFEQVSVPSEAEVREVIGGHLCRCTGYAGILAAALDVARARQEGG